MESNLNILYHNVCEKVSTVLDQTEVQCAIVCELLIDTWLNIPLSNLYVEIYIESKIFRD